MSDAPVAAPEVAQSNGAHPTTPQKPVVPPTQSKPEPVDDTEEYIVDGKPVRYTKAQRILHIQKSAASDKRLKEAADLKAKMEDYERELEADFEAAMVKRGKNPEKLIADHLARKAANSLKTPEQLERERIEKERDDAKAKLDEHEKKEKAAKQAELDSRNWQRVEKGILEAADRHGLESSPQTLLDLVEIGEEFLKYGIELNFDQLAEEHVRRSTEHIEKRDKRLLGLLEGKKLLAYIGDAGVAKVKAALAAADAESLKQIPAPQLKQKTQVRAHEREVKGYVRESDFDKKFKL